MTTTRPLSILSTLAATLALQVPAGAQVGAAEPPRDAPRISLELVDTDIRDALRMVAKQGNVDLVMSNAVQGSITLELNDASLQETLGAIVDVGGFEYSLSGGIVTVNTLRELLDRRSLRAEYAASTRAAVAREVLVIELDYVDANRVLPVIEKMLGEGGTAALLQTSDQVAQLVGYDEPVDGKNEEPGLQIGARLSSTTRGQPAKSHTIVVLDVPARLAQIERVVERIDVKPAQILIEARFVEVALDEDNKLGIDWNVVAQGNGASSPHTFPFGTSGLGSFDPNVVGGGAGSGVFPGVPNSVTTPTAAGLFTFGTLDFTAFSAVLRMIKSDARIQIVSNPRIVVDDRHTATILVGERFPVLSTNVTDFGTITEQLDHYEPIGVQLEVTPSVLKSGEIELLVRPSTSSLGPSVTGSTGLVVTRINSRQIDTSVTTRNGQTLVLGGLITTREAETTTKVPLLGDIPLLGRLFRHDSVSLERVDLVVFLTVTILEEDGLTDADREMFELSRSIDPGARGPRSELEFSTSPPQD